MAGSYTYPDQGDDLDALDVLRNTLNVCTASTLREMEGSGRGGPTFAA